VGSRVSSRRSSPVAGDDADVEVGDEDEDVGAVVRVADADVVQAAVVAQGHAAAVDDVAADAAVRLCEPAGGGGAGAGVPRLGRRAAVQRTVRPPGVVGVGERVELGLEPGDGGAEVMCGEPAFEGLVEAFDLAAGLGVVGAGVGQSDVQRGQVAFERDLAAAAGGGGEDRAVEFLIVVKGRCGFHADVGTGAGSGGAVRFARLPVVV
jgi:hypothetical protein